MVTVQIVDVDNGATGKRTASTRPAATSASTPATDEAGDEDKAKDAAGDEVKAKAGAGSEREPQGKYQKTVPAPDDGGDQAVAVMDPLTPLSDIISDKKGLCKDCQTKIILGSKGLRCTGRRAQIYQCGKCNSNCAQLTYACGKWPTDEFRTWDPQAKANFFRRGLICQDIRREYIATCLKTHKEKVIQQQRGEMRPLAFWENLGYDGQRIEKYTREEDKCFTDQTGWQYRVNINSVMNESLIQREITDGMKKLATRKATDAKESKVKARTLRRSLTKTDSCTSMSDPPSPEKKTKKKNKDARKVKKAEKEKKKKRKRQREEDIQAKDFAVSNKCIVMCLHNGCCFDTAPAQAASPLNLHMRPNCKARSPQWTYRKGPAQ